jgi:hypothetical protein
MSNILIVEKLGNIKGAVLKSEDDIYKKAGLKTAEGFKCYTTWTVEIGTKKYNISLYGKTKGRANSENKYEFPPPVDSVLFFGSCVLINRDENGKIDDLSKSEWDSIYETLYGGFEDLGDEDSDESDEEDDDPTVKRTKDGYVKDGFVVDGDDDEDDEEDDEDPEDEDDDEDEVYVKKPVKKSSSKKSSKITSVFELKDVDPENTYLDCTSELSEESYIE